jgi:probable poly-beta-1,6-N-acetyl-D-glucosamine export protein
LTKKPHIELFDYLRGIAILWVIMFHCFVVNGVRLAPSSQNLEIDGVVAFINNNLNVIGLFPVPLFIFVSGFILAYKYPGNSFNAFQFVKKRLISILPGYLIFSILSIIALGVFTGFPSLSSAIFMLLTFSANAPFWFFAIIVQLYILYPLLIRLYDYFETQNKLILLIAICILLNLAWKFFTPWFDRVLHDDSGLFSSRLFVPELVYFMGGILFCRNYLKIMSYLKRSFVYLVAIGTLAIHLFLQLDLVYDGDGIVRSLLVIVYISGIFVLSTSLSKFLASKNNWVAKPFFALGIYSYGIYLIHPFVRGGLFYLFTRLSPGVNNWMVYLLLFLLTTIISYLATRVAAYLPFSRSVIGIHHSIRS